MTEQPEFGFGGSAAELYERYMVPNFTGPWADALVNVAALQTGERVLDVACGTGVVARAAASAVGDSGEVIGLDVSTDMLDVARSVGTPTPTPLSWVEADVGESGLDDDEFDVVLSQQGFQYFPDKEAALRELRRVLKPGGRLLMTVWKGHSVFSTALKNALVHHISEAAGVQMDHQRTPPPVEDIQGLMAATGFTGVSSATQTLSLRLSVGYISQHLSAIPVSSAVNALDEPSRREMLAQIEKELRDCIADDEMVIPDTVYLISGRK